MTMSEFTIDNGILKGYIGSESIVEIPSEVEEIDVGAFRENAGIIKVIIPASVKRIKATAFRECINLEEICFSDGLESIGSAAFFFCKSLKKAILPDTVKTIGSSAFGGCLSLEKVVIPATAKIELLGGTIRPFDGVFNRCSSLKSIGPLNSGCNIEYGWEDTIPSCAFYGSELSSVIIADTIKKLESLSFRKCGNAMKVLLPKSCDLEKDVFDDDVRVSLSAPISSKDKISQNLVAYTNGEFFNNLTAEEIAWIILYQSKKWRVAALYSIKGRRAMDVLDSCYKILNDSPKISEALGLVLLDILNEGKNDSIYLSASNVLKDFLIQKKCNIVADSICTGIVQEELGERKSKDDRLLKLNPGEEIAFGKYPQEKPFEPAPINWIILAKNDNSAFLVSKECLAVRKYHEVRKKVSWAKSDLRQWLNDSFLKEAFTEEEQAIIETVSDDKVTLLTKDDIKKYISDIKQIAPKLTDYACCAETEKTRETPCAWWLKLPVGSEAKAPFVSGINLEYIDITSNDYSRYLNADFQVNYGFAVRPAIWVRVKE